MLLWTRRIRLNTPLCQEVHTTFISALTMWLQFLTLNLCFKSYIIFHNPFFPTDLLIQKRCFELLICKQTRGVLMLQSPISNLKFQVFIVCLRIISKNFVHLKVLYCVWKCPPLDASISSSKVVTANRLLVIPVKLRCLRNSMYVQTTFNIFCFF